MANIPISSFTAAANATGIGMSGFSLTGTNAQSMLDLAGTWNTSGAPTGIKLNVTDTTSNVASLLADLQVSGTSRFYVTKVGGGYFAGRVGVGTTSPETTLTVGGTAGSVTGAAFSVYETSTGNNARLRIIQSAGFVTYDATYSSGGNQQIWSNGGTERMRLTEAGSLGIGTNSPGAPLDVIGTARAGNFRVNAGGSVTGAGMWGIDTILAFNTGSTERMRIDSAGNLGVGTATPGYLVQVGSRISLGSDGVIQWGSALTGTSRGFLSWDTSIASINAASNLVLASNGTTERMRITAAGNVGIGTNAPGYQLHLGGDTVGAITGSLALGNVAGTPSALVQGFRGAGGDFAGSLLFSTTTGPGVVTERMRITSTGDVAIGVSPPTAKLHVISGTSPNAAQLLIGFSGASTNYYDANTQIFRDGAFTERMRIDASGAVVLPKLTLSTDTPFLTGANINAAANPLAIGTTGSGVVAFFTNNAERMRAKANGQVRFIPLASAPAGPEAGDVYYDSTTNKLRCYNGTIWNDLF